MPLRVFSLTGGIGSGKSTVAARFRERGLPVVDADALAREAVAPGSAGLAAIERAFGQGVLDAEGALDRKALARIVFNDEAARARLNAIVHPRVRELSEQRFAELEAQGVPLACYEVPLLFEAGLAEALRPVVVVSAPESEQVRRVVRRDGGSAEEALARVRSQLPLAEKTARADFVIDTTGSIEETRARADEVLDAIAARFGVPSDRSALPRA